MYKYYGDDVKKCGNSEKPLNRICQYTTSYIDSCKIIKVSNEYFDKCVA